jgi:hypothetical protein
MRSSLVLCLSFVGLGTTALRAASPVEELLRYVPPDVSFCLVIRDLRGHVSSFNASPFAQELRAKLSDALPKSPELQQLALMEQFLNKTLGLNLDRIRDDILGDAVVLAYRPGPPGKPELEQGLILIRAREAKPLADLIDRLNRMLKEVNEVEHNGFKYQRRVEGKEVNFLHLRGPVLVFSGQESMLREALALEKKTPASQESAVGRGLKQLGVEKSLASVWINPRAFDAELAAHLEKSSGNDRAFLKTFLTCWKSLDAVALTVSMTRDLELGVTLRGRPGDMPTAVRRFLEEGAEGADLWSRFPEDAMLALGSRTSAANLLAFLGAFQTKEAFEAVQADLNRGLGAQLGKDVVQEVLPHVGPDWGICVAAPSRGEKPWFPSMFFALRVSAGEGAIPVDRALLRQLEFYAKLVVNGYNRARKDSLRLKTLTVERQEVQFIASTKGEAMGLQPAFGLCDGYLVIASTPKTFRGFLRTPRPGKLKPSAEVPLMRVSFREVRQYLKDRRASLAAALAESKKLKPEEVGQQLDQAAAGLSFLDRMELTQRTTEGQVTFTLRLKPTQPLSK